MKNIKLHIIYLTVIVALVIALFVTNTPNLLRWYFYRDGVVYMEIKQDVDISNPETGDVIGKIYSGAVLQGPSIEDLDDTDLGDNDRWKILLDADVVKGEHRKYINSSNREKLKIPFRYVLKNTEHLSGPRPSRVKNSVNVKDSSFRSLTSD